MGGKRKIQPPLVDCWEQIRDLRQQGKSYPEIADALGIEKAVVKAEIAKMFRRGILTPGERVGWYERENPLEDLLPDPFWCKHTCKYKGCKERAGYGFSLVPLCLEHYSAIKKETNCYYSNSTRVRDHKERTHYFAIMDRIPWANKGGE